MKRFLALLAGLAGVAEVLRRRRRPAAEVEPSPADELRAKLAEARGVADARDEDEERETTVDAAPDPTPQQRRDEVHRRARESLDELSG